MQDTWTPHLGAVLLEDDRCQFRLWSPEAKNVELHLHGDQERYLPMQGDEHGYYSVTVENIRPGQRYSYRMGDQEYSDPASRCQPDGVYGFSEVVDRHFDWQTSDWRGLPLRDYIIYELHIGTFTPAGTFDSATAQLDTLAELGITAVELMPVTQFPGKRNWGYDIIFPFAVQITYGDGAGLKRFVDACHQRGIAVILDTVYNHFGAEGCCIPALGPYLSNQYKTPWGEAVNVDGAYSDEVRQFFTENALMWFYEFRIDALRLDAIHYIFDFSGRHFMREFTETIHAHARQQERQWYLLAETVTNDASLLRPLEVGGYGLDAIWNDDFHHAVYAIIEPESARYKQDYGRMEQLVKALQEGFVYTGEYVPSLKRRHGTPSKDISAERMVVYLQNHDQIGNRMPNERLIKLFPFETFKTAHALILLSPYLPMLFMGEEYGETAPFEFFIDSSNEEIVEATRKGRRESFNHHLKAGEEPPDPQAVETFERSKLNWELRHEGKHALLWRYHQQLIHLRKNIPALRCGRKDELAVHAHEQVLIVRRWHGKSEVLMAFNLGRQPSLVPLNIPNGHWKQILNSNDPQWSAPLTKRDTSEAPVFVEIDGHLPQLELPANSCIVFSKGEEPPINR